MEDPRRSLVAVWKSWYEKMTGRKCALRWGELMNRVYHMFEFPDEKTGEVFVEYPSVEDWEYQVEGFFEDKYARECGFPFGLFQKTYGRYHPRRARKQKSVVVDCSTCGTSHDAGAQCPMDAFMRNNQ